MLVASSDKFIEHSALVAEKLNISPIIIGLTLVALGTSAPEMVVSAIAALDNAPGIAIGNVIGSNIANIALVFGATLLVSRIPVKEGLATKEVPLLVVVTLMVGALLWDRSLDFVDGVILVATFVVALVILIRGGKGIEDELTEELPEDEGGSLSKSIIIAFVGLAVLIGSSKLLVWGAIGIASALGVSELIIGLTIVAIGTSLPELASSITSAIKGHHDIAVGNILGSNLFNLATVLPIPALIAPGAIQSGVLERDYVWMLGLTLLLSALIWLFGHIKSKGLPRWIGLPLLGGYFAYMLILYFSNGLG